MTNLKIQIPGRAPHFFGPEHPLLTVGRSSQNDIVIEDPSLSRVHARFAFNGGRPTVEDLGSLNGTCVNGDVTHGQVPVSVGDEILFGNIAVHIESGAQRQVLIEKRTDSLARATIVMSAQKLLSEKGDTRWAQAIEFIQEITLGLTREAPPQRLLEDLVERLFAFLGPDRGAVLLVDAKGEPQPVVVRVREGMGGKGQIRLSQTLVEAALERGEAMLINDPMNDPALASQSLIFSGVSTVIITPLEAEGQIIGLLYFDALPHRLPFTAEDLKLATVMAHIAAAKIAQGKLLLEVQKKKVLEQEMTIARSIQQLLLPQRSPDLRDWDVFGSNRASRQVSGDLFGFWPLNEDQSYVVIADVSGKGIGPGLLMASFQAFMSAWAELGLGPGALAEKLSHVLASRTGSNRFVTGFLIRLGPGGSFDWTSAGHNPGLILRADGSLDALPECGLPLAMLPGVKPYSEFQAALGPGDLLCLYTDGITEAESPDGEEFGQEGLVAALRGVCNRSLPEIEERIIATLDAFTQNAPPSDDRTLVLIRRR